VNVNWAFVDPSSQIPEKQNSRVWTHHERRIVSGRQVASESPRADVRVAIYARVSTSNSGP
jgi:hypothetical protein